MLEGRRVSQPETLKPKKLAGGDQSKKCLSLRQIDPPGGTEEEVGRCGRPECPRLGQIGRSLTGKTLLFRFNHQLSNRFHRILRGAEVVRPSLGQVAWATTRRLR
jgi:hypothetical protein